MLAFLSTPVKSRLVNWFSGHCQTNADRCPLHLIDPVCQRRSTKGGCGRSTISRIRRFSFPTFMRHTESAHLGAGGNAKLAKDGEGGRRQRARADAVCIALLGVLAGVRHGIHLAPRGRDICLGRV